VFTLFEGVDDQDEIDEGEEDYIEFFESGEDAAGTLKTWKSSLDFVPLAVHGFVVLPRFDAIAVGRNQGDKAEIQRRLAGFVVLLGNLH